MQSLKTFYFFNHFLLFSHNLKKSFQHIFVVFILDFSDQICPGFLESHFFLGQNLYIPVKLHIFFKHFFYKIFAQLKPIL